MGDHHSEPTAELTASELVRRLWALSPLDGPTTEVRSGFRSDDPGDLFLSVPMREVFALARTYADLDLDQIEQLLEHEVHEVRVAAVSVMDFQARRRSTPAARRRELYELYRRRHDRINNWDLVDRAAPSVVGGYLVDRARDPLYRLARSENVWERRTAITATWHFLQLGQVDDTFALAELLARDPHDLIQKAVGGWLREAGKRDLDRLRAFLDAQARTLPAVTLRYAIEHLDPDERRHYRDLRRSTDPAG